MPDRSDAFDIITDPDLSSRTAALKRNFALRLAAQVVYDAWYHYEDPKDLAKALTSHGEDRFEPSEVMVVKLLELSSSIDSGMLHVLRDVGVGAPQFGVAGMGTQPQVPASSTGPQGSDAPTQGRRRSFFR